MNAVVAVTAPRRTDGGQERVALNSAYVRALAAVGLLPLVVPPIVLLGEAKMKIPSCPLPSAAVPLTSVPMKFPCITLLVAVLL